MKEAGLATVHAITMLAHESVAALGALVIDGAVRVNHQAQHAADLAALAAASAAIEGLDPCQMAKKVSEKNQATMRECEMYGLVATITVETSMRKFFGHGLSFSSTARAAPRWYLDESYF